MSNKTDWSMVDKLVGYTKTPEQVQEYAEQCLAEVSESTEKGLSQLHRNTVHQTRDLYLDALNKRMHATAQGKSELASIYQDTEEIMFKHYLKAIQLEAANDARRCTLRYDRNNLHRRPIR